MSFTSDFNCFTARLREFIRSSEAGWQKKESPESGTAPPRCSESEFNSLALDLFGLQFKYNIPYRRFCESRNTTPETVSQWPQIPAIPTSAFKELELSCLPAGERTTVFHSSGTTEHRPSRHFHNPDSLAVYEASLWSWFQEALRHLNATEHIRPKLLVLTPPPARAPHSSLVHMFDTLRRNLNSPASAYTGIVNHDGTWTLDLDQTISRLHEIKPATSPLLLLGSAFSYVHLLDSLAERELIFALPAGSLATETGGYKGRSRTLPKSELHSLIARRLGIPRSHILCEYGMSELSSQAYESRTSNDEWQFRCPPWARAQIISPETGREIPDGETGLIRVFDLANVYSVFSVQTEDLGIRRGQGFELIGRASMAEARGCSLAAA